MEDLESGLPERLMKLLEEVKGGGGEEGELEDGEEGLVKMMDKMMSSFLFSQDVLYPFLTQTCKQVNSDKRFCGSVCIFVRTCF